MITAFVLRMIWTKMARPVMDEVRASTDDRCEVCGCETRANDCPICGTAHGAPDWLAF